MRQKSIAILKTRLAVYGGIALIAGGTGIVLTSPLPSASSSHPPAQADVGNPGPPPIVGTALPAPPPLNAVDPSRPPTPTPSPIPGMPIVTPAERLTATALLARSLQVQAVLRGRDYTISNAIPWTSAATGMKLGVAFEITFSQPQVFPASTQWLRMDYRPADTTVEPYRTQRYQTAANRVEGVFVTVHLPSATIASLDPVGDDVTLDDHTISRPTGR